MGGTQTRPPYFQFGAYRHGPFSGISKRTQEHENLCKYINSLLRTHADPEATWTSFVLGYNNSVPWHRDLHNDRDSRNYTCAFGSFTGGAGNPREHGGITGEGENTSQTVCPWTGERISLSAYTVRGRHELNAADCKRLKQCGFPLLRKPEAQTGSVRWRRNRR